MSRRIFESGANEGCMSLPSFPQQAVELSAEDAREVARLLALLLKREVLPSDLNALGFGGRPKATGRSELIAMATTLLAESKRRSDYFNPVMFGEPAWEMLLVLYISNFEGWPQTIGKLVASIGVPQTTALRWIDYLEKERLISRDTHPQDRRTVIVEITEKGREKLDGYFRSRFAFNPLPGWSDERCAHEKQAGAK
jgi:DNA-binding MarR family transcriptional regulator